MKPLFLPEKIRAHLLAAPDGATASETAKALGVSNKAVANAVKFMHDVYVDRWIFAVGRQGMRAILVAHPMPPDVLADRHGVRRRWCLANVPENCPRPDRPTK